MGFGRSFKYSHDRTLGSINEKFLDQLSYYYLHNNYSVTLCTLNTWMFGWLLSYSFKPMWLLYVYTTCFNIKELHILTMLFICEILMILRINGDYFPKQHCLFGFCNGDVVCLL